MTEGLLLFGLLISGLMMLGPGIGPALSVSIVGKVVVVVFVVWPLVLHFAGRLLVDTPRLKASFSEACADWWPLLLLATFITGGSLFARYAYGVDETFLSMGLGMFFLPLLGVAVDISDRKVFLLKGLATIYVILALMTYPMGAVNSNAVHETVFLAVPLGIYLLTARNPGLWRIVLGLALVFGTAISFKNTTFLLIGATMASWLVIVLSGVIKRNDALKSMVYVYLAGLAALIVLAAVVMLWMHRRNDLPDGSTVYRLEMYRLAYAKFLNSPIWGSGFSTAAVTYFSLYKVAVGTNYLPTHSDILDILSNGGLIAISLWAATVYKILRIFFSTIGLLRRGDKQDDRALRWLLVLGIVQIGAIITYAVNPPLNRIISGLYIWGGTGSDVGTLSAGAKNVARDARCVAHGRTENPTPACCRGSQSCGDALMKFSIATPTLNSLAKLKCCVGSVRGQVGIQVEHLVQDAMSRDGTTEWLGQQSDLLAVSERDASMYDAIERGWRRSTGDILSWLNSDEQYLPGTLERVRRVFSDHPAVDFVYGNSIIVGPDGVGLAARREIPLRHIYVRNGTLYRYSCTLFFRRSLLEEGLLSFDPQLRFAADADMVLKLLAARKRHIGLSQYLSLFMLDGSNLSCSPKMLEEIRVVAERNGAARSPVLRKLILACRSIEKLTRGYFQEADIDYQFAVDEVPHYQLMTEKRLPGRFDINRYSNASA